MRELHLFAGAGGGILAGMLLGHAPVCAVEIDPYCRRVLRARQADGYLPADMEIHDDVTTFDGTPWRGRVDVVAGGFPCQDISIAGKGKGIDGERSGLWWHMQRIIREVRPKYCFVENAPTLVGRGLHRVLGSLAEIGYDAEWCVLGARHVGAPHRRDRIWILAADADRRRCEQRDAVERQHELADAHGDVPNAASWQGDGRDAGVVGSPASGREGVHAAAGAGCPHDPNTNCGRCEKQRFEERSEQRSATGDQPDGLCPRGRRDGQDLADSDLPRCAQQRSAVAAEPQCAGAEHRGGDTGPCDAAERGVGRGVDGLAAWLDRSATGFWQGQWETTPRVTLPPKNRTNRLHALGNGQVPQCAATAWNLLMQRLEQP